MLAVVRRRRSPLRRGRIVIYEGRLAEHLTGKHDQKTHGRGRRAAVALDALARDGTADIAAGDLDAFMVAAAGRADNPNLVGLTVGGKPIFGGSMGLARGEMPVLGSAVLPGYLAHLSSSGVTVRNVRVKPRALRPMQREVSASAAGKQYVRMKTGTMDRKPLVISKDGFVLDGHHRWAAGSAANTTLDAIQVGLPGRAALRDALAFNASTGVRPKAIGEALAEYSPGQHRDQRGRWAATIGGAREATGLANGMHTETEKRAAVAKWQSTYEACAAIQADPDSADARAFASAVVDGRREYGAVYRGFDEYRGSKKVSLEASQAAWEKRIGKRIEMNVPTSTSPDLVAASGFGKVVFEITGGRAHDISYLSSVPVFKESVLLPDTFGVVGVRKGPDIPNSSSPFRTDTSPTVIVSLAAVPAGL